MFTFNVRHCDGHRNITDILEEIMAQLDDLRSAQADVSARIAEVAAQVAELVLRPGVNLAEAIAEERAQKVMLDAIPPSPPST